MKLLLVALNAKYIHSNLAVHSLKAYCSEKFKEVVVSTRQGFPKREGNEAEIEIAEYTINQPVQKVLADIYRRAPSVLFFSCYLWNRQEIERLSLDLAKVMPEVDIWLGGPEVSFDALQTLERLPHVKGVMRGEGEETFYQLAIHYAAGLSWIYEKERPDVPLEDIKGITFRNHQGAIVETQERAPLHMDSVPFPYENLEVFGNRIVYYESSRGCPFRCSYCLSSVEKTLRFRNLEQVKQELCFLLECEVPQVKFIDRTFNCNQRHTLEIWKHLKEHDNGVTNFHFEIAGDLLTEEATALLGTMRPGQIQLEIGVQSTNEDTLREINRRMDVGRLRQMVSDIRERGNIHVHLDLIAGLPYEDLHSFRRSFNEVFAMRPHQLQLGFLKVLKGSPMEERRKEYGLCYTDMPPYEVLETKWLSYGELLRLKMVEEMVETYYNSGQFTRSLELLLTVFDSSFGMFEELALWYEAGGFDMLELSRNRRYENLLRFGRECCSRADGEPMMEKAFLDALIYDYFARENGKNRPVFFGEERVEKAFSKAFYSVEAREHRYLNGTAYGDISDPRLLRKLTHLEKLGGKYYLFDYSRRDPVSGNARVVEISGN